MSVCVVRAPLSLSDIYRPEAIRNDLDARSKQSVIKALVRLAVDLDYIRRTDELQVLQSVLAREAQASTGLGHGLAIPHCQWGTLDRVVGMAALVKPAISFDSMDGQPVNTVFLTLSNARDFPRTIDLLGRLLAIVRNKSQQLLLSGCETAMQVTALLEKVAQPANGRLDDLARSSLSQIDAATHDPQRELAFYSMTLQSRDHRTNGAARGGPDIW